MARSGSNIGRTPERIALLLRAFDGVIHPNDGARTTVLAMCVLAAGSWGIVSGAQQVFRSDV